MPSLGLRLSPSLSLLVASTQNFESNENRNPAVKACAPAMPRFTMRAAVSLVVLYLCLVAGARQLRAEDFGLGLMVGDPTGVSGQLAAGSSSAFNGAVGLDLLNDGDLYVHIDYIRFLGELTRSGSVTVPFYIGGGAFVGAKKDATLGARVPFGVQLDFSSAPVHLFAEISFRLQVVDKVKAGLGGALGFRYFF